MNRWPRLACHTVNTMQERGYLGRNQIHLLGCVVLVLKEVLRVLFERPGPVKAADEFERRDDAV